MKAQLAAMAVVGLLSAQAGILAATAASAQGSSAQKTERSPALKPNEVAIIGCLQRESDYRAINDKGRGGILGTGIGADKEYVIVDVTPAQQSTSDGKASSTARSTRVFRLSGPLEESLVRDVGRTVEVVGVVQPATSEGDLPRLTVSLSHPVGDFCPNK